MPNSHTIVLSDNSKMTAKRSLSILKGNLSVLNGQRVEAGRVGDDTYQLEKEIAATRYAIAAVKTFVATGKSAPKAAAAIA